MIKQTHKLLLNIIVYKKKDCNRLAMKMDYFEPFVLPSIDKHSHLFSLRRIQSSEEKQAQILIQKLKKKMQHE